MRRIAGCVPIRKIEDEQDPLKGLCLLLINSRKRANTLVFPKGGIKRHEEAAEAALRETYEEAGVEGPILAQLEPHYCITSPGEWVNLEREAPESWFLMQVKQTHEDWPEREERTRLWISLGKVLDAVHHGKTDLVLNEPAQRLVLLVNAHLEEINRLLSN